ncbi:MAG: hypothetical protein LBN20_00945, partial [Endomicrobium sp.]|nr:hypothetical protein [Endomicrobium sp.]
MIIISCLKTKISKYTACGAKKALIFLLFLLVFGFSPANAQSKYRYIVFFAQSLNIPQSVINRIMASNYFSLTIPIDSAEIIPNNIAELIASGKGEPALSFKPEPLFPLVSSVYGPAGYTPDRQDILSDYFKNNISEFKSKMNMDNFGLFLKSGEVSNDLLLFFNQNKFIWANASNTADNIYGAYKINGMNTFAVYKNLPNNSGDIMKWLEARKESIIPVILTERQLNDIVFMTSLINIFEKSQYIKPAIPLYINNVEKEKFVVKNNVSFSNPQFNSNIMDKLNSAADVIHKYKSMKGYSQTSYKNAQSEFLILSNYQLLYGVESKNPENLRAFSAIHDNVLKFVGISMLTDAEMDTMKKNISVYENKGEDSEISADIVRINGGISIANNELIKNISVISANSNIQISIKFNTESWDSAISFIDVYIDMNNIDGLGSIVMLKGVKGFLDSANGWEYAVRIYRNRALLYRDSQNGQVLLGEFAVQNNTVRINRFIRGNPANWAIQAIAVDSSGTNNAVIDFLGSSKGKSKKDILLSVPLEIP